ncbi:MAG TPA: cytochrome c5 family protein [Oxalobacteraceae bacterium]|jgi:cytochrome c5|nr:cytochrome c5 family protein [Oxalobacteraceae bacterium]
MNTYKFLPLIIVAALAGCGQKTPVAADASASAAASPAVTETPAATASAPAPSAPVAAAAPAASAPAAVAAGPAPSADDLAKGEKVYTATCVACHAAAVLGAPKFGDKALWAPRIAQGKDALYSHALNGFKMMPPRGGNAALKDDEVKAGVDYMVSKAS